MPICGVALSGSRLMEPVPFGIRADRFVVREYCNIHGLWKG
ncbi:MAG: hypothetical protein AB1640_07080 [bacterium]